MGGPGMSTTHGQTTPFTGESRCFHSLRNTYVSQLFDAGLTIDQVQRFARHSDVRPTTKYAKPKADEALLVDDLHYPGLT
jgi:integrase